MKVFLLFVSVLLLFVSCGPAEKVDENPCDYLVRNQTGVKCEGVVLHWGGKHYREGVMGNEATSSSLKTDLPDAPVAELEFMESLTGKWHELTVDMRGIDKAAVSKSGQCINVVYDLTRAKMIIGKSMVQHVDLGPQAAGP